MNPSKSIRDYIIIVLGMAIYAIGFTVFILPHEIVTGGMAGFSTLVYYFSGETIPVGATMFGANLLLLAGGYRTLGREFVVRTVFGAALLSVMIGLIEGYFTSHAPIVSDNTMSVLMGSFVCGIGIGLYYSHNGSAGGTDIVVAYLDKKGRSSFGRGMFLVDVTIVSLSFLLPFEGDMDARVQARVQTILYGWASIFIYTQVADMMINANRQTIQFNILSNNWQRISDRITHELGRGVTTLNCTGYWTGTTRTMMIVWCRQYDTDIIYNIVNEEDPEAYVIATEARSVHGNGFDPLKRKITKHSHPTATKAHSDSIH